MRMTRRTRASLIAVMLIAACRPAASPPAVPRAVPTDVAPPAPPARWLGLIGEYGPDANIHLVLEQEGRLVMQANGLDATLSARPDSSYVGTFGSGEATRVGFVRDGGGRATRMTVGRATLERRQIGPESGNQLLVTPIRPMDELRREAFAASPPAEVGPFRATELVELVTLDSTIRLEIRYATSNNLFGTPFYSEARAFLQRPAAEALVRVSAALRPMGFGLLVHDGYRPWYVTKMFFEAAPPDKRNFVANPAQGSRHNRGAAVDLTLYSLATGVAVEMPGTYDETTARSAPTYAGGTTRQRWHRDVLRRAMEAERFTVNEDEWWHFDFADWRQYGIGNLAFDRIGQVTR